MLIDLFADDWDVEQDQPGFRCRRMRLARRLGAEQLGASVYLLPPGERSFPFHFHYGNEELLVTLRGAVAVRTPNGEITLGEGQATLFPRGPGGAHQVINRGSEPARFLVVSGMAEPEITSFPDTGKFGLFAGAAPGATGPADFKRFVAGAEADYFAEEPTGE